jgi:acyl-[acyl-carrier-protein] desaturase
MTAISDDGATFLSQRELLLSLQNVVEQNLGLLKPIDTAWQPSDFLPNLTRADWQADLVQFRETAQQLRDELLVVLVGDMVTEEALPNYAISLNLIAGDEAGDSEEPWARWMRGWTSEENRHGDLLNAYLRLTGRVDMRAVEVTVNHLIARGFNPRANPDLYSGIIYTSFQERATKLSHARVGKLAAEQGNAALARICGKIAGDESRHEQFYKTMMGKVMDSDPARAIVAFRNLVRRVIAMPGRLMYDGKDPDLFEHFAAVAQRMGVYTVHDYIAILRHLLREWNVAARSVSGRAAAAQDYLCQHVERLQAAADEIAAKAASQPPVRFGWVSDRAV